MTRSTGKRAGQTKAAEPKVETAPEPTTETAPADEATTAPVSDATPEPAAPTSETEPEAPAATSDAEGVAPIPGVPEIKAEPPFGEDPDDLAGASDEDLGGPGDGPSSVGATTSITYHGLREREGAPAAQDPVAVTVTVPVDHEPDYDRLITAGRTYTLHRGKPIPVAEADAAWLIGYPAFRIEANEAE